MSPRKLLRLCLSLIGLIIIMASSHSIFVSGWPWLIPFWILTGLAVYFSCFIDNPKDLAGELLTLAILVVPALLLVHFFTYSYFNGGLWWIASVLGVLLVCVGCMDAVWQLRQSTAEPEKEDVREPKTEKQFLPIPISRDKIVTSKEIFKLRCTYCGILYDASLDECPRCGGAQ